MAASVTDRDIIERLRASQKACFDAGQHIAAMDIQSARDTIERLSREKEYAASQVGEDVKLANQVMRLTAREQKLVKALEPFGDLATKHDEVRRSGECHSWIEFITDFYWPNEGQCVTARAALSDGGGKI